MKIRINDMTLKHAMRTPDQGINTWVQSHAKGRDPWTVELDLDTGLICVSSTQKRYFTTMENLRDYTVAEEHAQPIEPTPAPLALDKVLGRAR